MTLRLRVTTGALLSMLPACAFAGGPLGIDHRVAFDNSGIWKRSYQKDLAAGAALTVLGGALFADSDTRLGRTFDQSLDAMVFTAGTTTVMKYAFSRERPIQDANPNDFFKGHGYQSFPSGEVAEISAVVTPFIAEYGSDHPAAWALAVLPVYDAIARVKVQGHWQSDVLVGAAVGVGWGLYSHHRKTPLIMGLLPGRGLMVGYHKKF
ncbi:MAG: phosphatase PAP2 family protein [Thermomonas sp.]